MVAEVSPHTYALMDPTTLYEIYRIPATILPALEIRLQQHGDFIFAWLQAVSTSFPGRNLLDVLRRVPTAFPPCSDRFDPSLDMQVGIAEDSQTGNSVVVILVADLQKSPKVFFVKCLWLQFFMIIPLIYYVLLMAVSRSVVREIWNDFTGGLSSDATVWGCRTTWP